MGSSASLMGSNIFYEYEKRTGIYTGNMVIYYDAPEWIPGKNK